MEDDYSEGARARRDDRGSTAMVEDMKEIYELVLESYDAYLDSINLGMLLEAAKHQEDKREFLAQCLYIESERLGKSIPKIA